MAEFTLFKGRPTAPTVRKLMEAYSDVKHGDTIELDEFTSVMGEDESTRRWGSVYNKWKEEMKKKGFTIPPREPNSRKIRILTQEEATAYCGSLVSKGTKLVVRSRQDLATLPDDELDEVGKKKRQGIGAAIDRLIEPAREMMKKVKALLSISEEDKPPKRGKE